MFHQPFFHLSQHHQQQQQQQQQHKQGLPSAHEGSTVFHDGEAELSSRMSAAAAAVAVASKLTGGNHSNNNNNHSSNHAWTKTDWYLGFRKHNNYYQHHSYQQQQQQQQQHQHLGTSRPATTGTVTSFLGMIRQQQHSNRRNATCCQDGDETETNRSPNCNSNCKRKRDRSDSDTATTNTTMTTPSSSLFFTDSYISEDDCTEEGTIDFSLDGVDENIHIRNEEEEDDDDDDDEHVGDAETESKDDHRVREPMQDGSDVEDWSDSTEVRRNATSVLIREAAEKTITTTTKTKTTTTTTTTHTTTATATATATAATDTKHKNKSIFVYPQVFVNAQESGAIPSSISNTNSTKSETGSKHSAPWIGSSNNGSLVSFDGPEVNSGSGIVTVTSPDTSVTTNPRHHSQQQQICCPCCASKEREIKRQRNELKHMGVLVKKLCGLLADTVRVQSSQKKRNHKSDAQKFLVTDEHEREHEQEAIVLSSAARQRHGVNDNRDSDTSTATTTSASLVASSSATSSSSLSLASSLSSSSSSLSPLPLCRQRKIGSRPIRSVGASCPRSKNHRIEVNGEVGTYSGPAMSTRVCSENESEHNYQRSGILQGCVVRFDNDELYVGSLSRNDTGSLTFHPPGTLYDANRVPKRRIR